VGGSLGVAVFPEDAGDMETLCITADLRMYENKRGNSREGDEALRCENCEQLLSVERRNELGMVH
jgi:predicted signal transduction protein with EAL and GGDEF domain